MAEKKNDWIVATLNNPSLQPEDMEGVLGLTVDNTQILTKDQYLKSDYIKNHEAFKNEDGSFSQSKFDSFYNYAVGGWDKFTNEEKMDTFEYSLFNVRQKPDSRIKDPNFRFETVLNPDRLTTGISGINVAGERKYTPSELAQTQRIFDSATGLYIDETPNDRALFNSPGKWLENLFSEPLVLATYDEDTEEFDPFYGKVVKHKKGEYKLNSEGTYYAETLNGRSLAGKQVIHNSDIITADDSKINKYDFFDSDSLDKSVGGTVAKTVATIVPLFFGPVGYVYSGLLIARELTKSLPMLYGMTTSLFGNESEPEFLNTLAGYGEKFSGGTSEYGSQHTFSFELFGKLVGDVATQWGQQQLIARAVSKLRGSNQVLQNAYKNSFEYYKQQLLNVDKLYKAGLISFGEILNAYRMAGLEYGTGKALVKDWSESSFGKIAMSKFMPAAEEIVKRNSRLGADAALAYMAIVSNYDVYNNMLERGATHKDAALVSLGSTIGMFSVDKFLHLGEMFFDDLEDNAQKSLRLMIKEGSDDLANTIYGATGSTRASVEGSLFKRIGANQAERVAQMTDANKLKKAISFGRATAEEFSNSIKYYKEGVVSHTLGAGGKALGEGLEEVSEEFVSDISKQLYEWAGALGADTSIKDAGAWENWFERYAMSFLGGAIGGATFYGVGKFNEAKDNKTQNAQAKSALDEIIYLLRQHKKADIMQELQNWKDEGKLGSTKLGIRTAKDENGNTVYLKAEEGEMTQNDVIYNILSQEIDILDSIILEYGSNLSEDELFKQMVLGDDRLMQIKEKLGEASYNTKYRLEFQSILERVIKLRLEIDSERNSDNLTDLLKRRKEAELKKEDTSKIQQEIDNITKNISSKEKELLEQVTKLNDFISGKNSLEYSRKLVWLSDPYLSSIWTYNTFNQWLKKKKNLTMENLSVAELETLKGEYLTDLNVKKDFDIDLAWNSFLDMEKDFTPFLTELEQNPNKAKEIKDNITNIFLLKKEIDEILKSGLPDWDTKLDDESDEDYNHRDDYKNASDLDEELLKALKEKTEQRKKKIDELRAEKSGRYEIIKEKFKQILNLSTIKDLDPITYRALRLLHIGKDESGKNFGYTRSNVIKLEIEDNLLKKAEEEGEPTKISEQLLNLNLNTIKSLLITYIDNLIETEKLKGDELTKRRQILNELSSLFNEGKIDELINKIIDLGIFEYFEIIPYNEKIFDTDDYTDEDISNYIEEIKNDPEKLNEIKNNLNQKLLSNQSEFEKYFLEDLTSNVKIENLNLFKENLETVKDEDDLIAVISAVHDIVDDDNAEKIRQLYDEINQIFRNIVPSLLVANSEEEIVGILNNLFSELKISFLNLDINGDYTENVRDNFVEESNRIIDKFILDLNNLLLDNIKLNPIIQFSDKKDVLNANPLAEILSIISEKYGISKSDLETLLSKLQDRIDNENLDDFILTDYELDSLKYLDHILDLVTGFIYLANTIPTWLSSQGHARFWNDFAKKNKDIVGDFHLPEIDSDLALIYMNEIKEYKEQIKKYEEIHATNAINKEKLFIDSENKLESAKVNFYKLILKYLNNIGVKGFTVDLLDEIKDSDTSLDIESKIATNLFNFLELNKISLKDFLKESKLLEQILPGLESILSQDPSDLDDKLDYNQISGYQKFLFILGALLNNSKKFESRNKLDLDEELKKEEGNRIAPISILKQIILLGTGFINSSYVINQIYSYLEDELNIELPILDRCMIIEGVGGAGKTRAVVNKIVRDLNPEDVWIAAPGEKQLDTLSASIGKYSKKLDRELLLNEALVNKTAYSDALTQVDKEKSTNEFEIRNHIAYIKDIEVKHSKNLPKVLIIDEATHFRNEDIQVINKWARENEIQVILSGDSHQLGHLLGNGFDRSFTLFRTSKLKTSLRESNIHVQNNNAKIDKVFDVVNVPPEGLNNKEEEDILLQKINDELSKVKLTYYLDNAKLNGTAVIKLLSEEFITPLKDNSKSVCFIGSTDSETFKKLKDSGVNIPGENIFLSINEIQGSEFDYVICDTNLKIPEDVSGVYFGDIPKNLLSALYTLNTRAKEGLIIIDNDFTEIYPVENIREFNTAQARTIKEAVNRFIDREIQKLQTLDLSGEHHDLSEITEISNEDETSDEDKVDEAINDLIDEKPRKIKDSVEEKTKEDERNPEDSPDVDINPETLKNEKEIENKIIESDFSMNVIGYSMPILGGYTRKSKDGKNEYSKLDEEVVNGITILKDLSTVTILDRELKSKKKLTVEDLKNATSTYFDLIKQIATVANGKTNLRGNLESKYIDGKTLQDILSGKSKRLLADGRTEGIYLEVEDYGKGDRFIGLGTAKDTEEEMSINGKVYKYVLRFVPRNNDFPKNTEIAITISLAARPATWLKKLNELDYQISQSKDLSEKEELQKEKLKLDAEIKTYTKYLELLVKTKPKGVKVKINGAFSKIRELSEKKRFSTLYIPDNGKWKESKIDYDRGWLDNSGKYKTVSDIYILGNDLDVYGIKASNSGKAVVFVSDFYYNRNELKDIYESEKKARKEGKKSLCTVRLIPLDNAGINWSSLTNSNYKDLYRSGEKMELKFPFKSEVMGYRFLVAMWNWRADLYNFLNIYKQEFTDLGYTDDKVLKIIGASDEIYKINENFSGEKDVTDEINKILTKFNVISDDIIKLKKFNNETCKNIHTFRLGAFSLGKHIQRLNVDINEYFGNTKIPQHVKDKGIVMGLAITPQRAKEYFGYIDELFKIFNHNEELSNLSITRKKGDSDEDTEYSISDRIDGDRLGQLTKFKSSDESRASGKSFTNFLEGLTNNEIEITDPDDPNKKYTITIEPNRFLMSLFMSQVTHLFHILKISAFKAANGFEEGEYRGKIKIFTDLDKKNHIELDYSELESKVLNSETRHDLHKEIDVMDSDPSRGSFDFEFGDMFDLMLHGSVQDVSTHAIEFKDGAVSGGRESNLKISGAMFPKGIFIDPRIMWGPEGIAKGNRDENKYTLFKTTVDPRLLMISTETQLVYNITLPTLGEIKEELESTIKEYEFDLDAMAINEIEENVNVISRETKLGNKTLEELIPGLKMSDEKIKPGEKTNVEYNGKLYELHFEKNNNVGKIYLSEPDPISIKNNVIEEIPVIPQKDDEDLKNNKNSSNLSQEFEVESTTIDDFWTNDDGIEGLDYSYKFKDGEDLQDKLDKFLLKEFDLDCNSVTFDKVGETIEIKDDSGELKGIMKILNGKLMLSNNTINTADISESTSSNGESIPEDLLIISDEIRNDVDELESHLDILEYFKNHSEELKISNEKLKELNKIIKNLKSKIKRNPLNNASNELLDDNHWIGKLYGLITC